MDYRTEPRRRALLNQWRAERDAAERTSFVWQCVLLVDLALMALAASFGSVEWVICGLLVALIVMQRRSDAAERRIEALEEYTEHRDDRV